MSLQLPSSTFWRRWVLVGLVAGLVAGTLLLVSLIAINLLRQAFPDLPSVLQNGGTRVLASNFLSMKFIVSFIVPGGLYGFCQSVVPWLVLRDQTPKLRRSLQAHFVATIIGTIVVGVLLFWLFSIGLGSLLTSFGLSPSQILVISIFIVGGFGGIAQAIVQRSLLDHTTPASYLRWIVPLALLGHVSGAIVGLIAMPLIL